MQGCPCFLIYFRLQGCLQRLVWIVCTQEVGVADEEAFFVVICIYKPAGNAVGAIAADLAGVGVEHVYAILGLFLGLGERI